MSLDEYEFINVPGISDIRIPIVKRTSEQELDSTGVRTPEWMIAIEQGRYQTSSAFGNYTNYTELFGFYCESSRYIKGEASIHLYTSGTLLHSEVFLATQNGAHLAFINHAVAGGTITGKIEIIRVSKINGMNEIIQKLTFSDCHWCGVQSYLDWNISRFTACKRENIAFAFEQNGLPKGRTSCVTSYTGNTSDFGIDSESE